MLNDNDGEERNYTVFTNSTWVIYQRCSGSNIFVTCVGGSWSENITCSTSNPITSITDTGTNNSTIYTIYLLPQLLYLMIGELVVEKAPVCPDDSAIYRCSVNDGRLEWDWTLPSGSPQQLLALFSGLHSGPPVVTKPLDMATVVFNITSISSSYINVTATVNEAQLLNGTLMECGTDRLTINLITKSKCLCFSSYLEICKFII